ncbi:hypothetical protein [Calothrix rhizosoleniae]|uniref:hypothetical protein n=1 Tax=Calothrix rhizosoleniae TaxID=888997 RepID=UPI0011773641|nr:hypothetical protein [Calothrix rhizosoleniae]
MNNNDNTLIVQKLTQSIFHNPKSKAQDGITMVAFEYKLSAAPTVNPIGLSSLPYQITNQLENFLPFAQSGTSNPL